MNLLDPQTHITIARDRAAEGERNAIHRHAVSAPRAARHSEPAKAKTRLPWLRLKWVPGR